MLELGRTEATTPPKPLNWAMIDASAHHPANAAQQLLEEGCLPACVEHLSQSPAKRVQPLALCPTVPFELGVTRVGEDPELVHAGHAGQVGAGLLPPVEEGVAMPAKGLHTCAVWTGHPWQETSTRES
jgi:hypothetical protein